MKANLNFKKTILIADDDLELLTSLVELLRSDCDEILTAKDGAEALKILKENSSIVAILSDIRMPNMNGLEFLGKIRGEFNPIPFVIFTSFGDGKTFSEAVKLDATDFISKPFDDENLRRIMIRAIDFGLQLKKSNFEIEKLLEESPLSSEEKERFRRAKHTIYSMRIGSSLYLKNKKAS